MNENNPQTALDSVREAASVLRGLLPRSRADAPAKDTELEATNQSTDEPTQGATDADVREWIAEVEESTPTGSTGSKDNDETSSESEVANLFEDVDDDDADKSPDGILADEMDRGDGDDELTHENIECHACGETTMFIGADAHPGVCGTCGSHFVSAAGSIRVDDVDEMKTVPSEAAVDMPMFTRLVGSDSSDRDFVYLVEIVSISADSDGRTVDARLSAVLINYTNDVDPAELMDTDLVPVTDLIAALEREFQATNVDLSVTSDPDPGAEESL